MTTPKPDGAGPTMDIKPCPFCGNKMILQAVKPHRGLTLLCLGIDCPINGFEIRLMYWKRPWEILKSERAEAEKKIKELEKRLLRDETVDYRAEQAHWILMKQVKELELKYQAAREVSYKLANGYLDTEKIWSHVSIDKEIEVEFQRLKEETNDNT